MDGRLRVTLGDARAPRSRSSCRPAGTAREARRALRSLAVAGLVAAGCNSGDDDGSGPRPREVTTTRVQVVEGLGQQGGFDPAQIYERLAPGGRDRAVGLRGRHQPPRLRRRGRSGLRLRAGRQGLHRDQRPRRHERLRRRRGRAGVRRVLGRQPRAGEIVGVDPNADVALLKVDPEGLSLTPLRLGRVHSIDVGEPVAAIGSPFGERQSLSIGVVSARRPQHRVAHPVRDRRRDPDRRRDQPGQLRRARCSTPGPRARHQRPDQVSVRRRRGRGLRDPGRRGAALAAELRGDGQGRLRLPGRDDAGALAAARRAARPRRARRRADPGDRAGQPGREGGPARPAATRSSSRRQASRRAAT